MITSLPSPILKRITVLSDVCNGKPTIRGMRITGQTILQYLSVCYLKFPLKSYTFRLAIILLNNFTLIVLKTGILLQFNCPKQK
ncbi:MAG: DUF433 domain-containing protein [Bacteroidia bacterium]|nr:DUF433 domain-containing protein [Bacteroidia bacterium]